MGNLCAGHPPDLTEQHGEVADWEEMFGSGSVWIGTANLHNHETDYLEVSVTSKYDHPLHGRRVLNIAKGSFAESTRFEFAIEKIPKKERKSKDSPTHIVVFYWEDESGLTLRGTVLNEEKVKIEGIATLPGEEESTLVGEFALARAIGPSRQARISPRNKTSQSTYKLVEEATIMANSKFESEEVKRKSAIQTRVLQMSTSAEYANVGKRSPDTQVAAKRDRVQSAV